MIKPPDHAVNNPCLKEQNITYRCFDKNDYDKTKCIDEIDNYNYCKKFWGFVKLDRRRRGIKPYLPPIEERDQIKKEYFEQLNK